MRKLLSVLRKNNIHVRLSAEGLSVDAPEEMMNENLLEEVRLSRDALISYLKPLQEDFYTPIPGAPEQPAYPLSSSQQYQQTLKDTYPLTAAYRLEGPVNREALSEAFVALISRFEILRTVFKEDDTGMIKQFVRSPAATASVLLFRDMRDQPASAVNELSGALAAEPFDLASGPLFRAGLFQTAAERYTLIYVLHPLITDDWSMEILMKEWMMLYNACCRQELPAPPRIQYKDYTTWQREQLSTLSAAIHKGYWLKQFAGALPGPALPGDQPVVMEVLPPQVKHARFSSEATLQLKNICREQEATLLMGLVALVHTLLYRYTGQEDIIISTPAAGREHADLEEQPGLYAHTLPLRPAFETTDSFRQLLAGVKAVTLEAYEHQVFPFHEWATVPGLSAPDVMVAWHRQQEILSSDLKVHPLLPQTSRSSGAALIFDFSETAGCLELNITYNQQRYSNAMTDRLTAHLEQLLDAVAAGPDTAVLQLSYLSATEKQQLVETFNEVPAVSTRHKTVVQLFEEQAARTPAAPALRYGDKTITYQQLNEQANQLAHYLKAEKNIGADDPVGIRLERSDWMMTAILGVLKAGGAYVPVDPEYPQERVDYMLQNSGCRWLIDTDLTEVCSQKQYSIHNPATTPQPGDLAYIIYTSGSTGLPKGCSITHENLSNYVQWAAGFYFNPSVPVNFGLYTSLSFDLTVTSIYCSLTTGGCLFIYEQSAEIPAILRHSFSRESGINSIKLTPSHINVLKYEEISSSSMLCAIVGGEDIAPGQVSILKQISPDIRIYNEYGPTETTVGCVVKELEPGAPVLIGRPVAGARIYILDDAGGLCPAGVPGEIYIAGAGLARGYYHNAALTAEKFLPDPFRSGERMYKTGDLGRWLPDGNIIFMGRKDDQVKIRGHRIEPGEVEAALQSHPEITAAAVLVSQGETEKELVAYIAGRNGLQIRTVREYLSARLPVYMLPGRYIALDAMPLTTNGKTDRQKLPALAGRAMETGAVFVAPRNETEAQLVRIWQEVLEEEDISVTDNFFDRGGHSLSATRLASLVQKRFGAGVGFNELFDTVILEDQARLIENARKTAYAAITPVALQPHYALSSSQRRLWLISRNEAASVAYNITDAYQLEGIPDTAALERAYNTLINRYEILRTVFRETPEGEIRQFVLPAAHRLTVEDLRGTPDPDTTAGQRLQTMRDTPFDLANGPLIKAALFRTGEERYVFTYTLHHIISDGWSAGILIKEFFTLFAAYATGSADPLPALRIQYKDYAAWQQAWLSGASPATHRDYWLQQFAQLPPVPELPADHIRPAVLTYEGATTSRVISPALMDRVKTVCEERGATLFMGLLAAVNVLLYRYTGQEDLIIGTPIAGREHADLEGQAGLFLNTLPLRTTFKGEDSFRQLLSNVKTMTLAAYEHQAYPFDELVDALNIPWEKSRSALFDVMIILQHPVMEHETVAGVPVSRLKAGENRSCKFDLTFDFMETAAGLSAGIEYNRNIYTGITATRMLSHLVQLLEAMVRQPAKPVRDLNYLSESEQQQLLVAFNNSTPDNARDKTITTLFEAQVRKTPEQPALLVNQEVYAFSRLNALANRLAHYLAARHGIRPNDLVAIRLERNAWLVTAILAVMKAGAAYVPLDPGYPQERLDFMLADSGSKVLMDDALIAAFMETETSWDDSNPGLVQSPQDLAYVIYTSGSTGRPKGVMITHESVVSFFDNFSSRFFLYPGMLFGATTNYTFDISVLELLGTLVSGLSLLLVTDPTPTALLQAITEQGMEALQITPSRLNQLLETGPESLSVLGRLKVLLVGGEALTRHNYERLKTMTGTRIINVYGPTETTIWSTSLDLHASTTLSIGSPLLNEYVYITDAQHRPCPIGVQGEICIGGEGLARGYLNNAALTAEKFTDNPFRPGEKMYKTGDVGRWLPDGHIEFMGRKDDQVKIRGYRIETGEIENALQYHPDVEAAAVIAVTDAQGDKELIAYVAAGKPLQAADLRAYLSTRLPAYMLPGRFIALKELPLTISGKVDKKRLPDPAGQDLGSNAPYVAPRDETETKLMTLWQEILGRKVISVKDDFISLGGHSLKATRLAGKIYQTFDVSIGLNTLFNTGILEDQASLITKARKTPFMAIPAIPEQPYYPLSYAQRRLWIISQFPEASMAYNMPAAYEVQGDFNAAAMEQAFEALVTRHEILRTSFEEDEQGEIRQFVHAPETSGFKLLFKDLRTLPSPATSAQQLVEVAFKAPFDFTRCPMLRAVLYHVANDRWILAYVIHHIISDAWSLDFLHTEIFRLYHAFARGEILQPAPLRIQYKDYVAWQQQRLSEERLMEHKTYWLQQFSGQLPLLDLPGGKPRPAVKTYRGATVTRSMQPHLSEGINALAREQGSTLFMALTAAVNALFYRYTGQEDIIIGTPVADREHVDTEDQIGFYVNTIALRIQFNGSNNYLQLLDIVKQQVLGAFEHQEYPFDKLVDELQLQRDISRNPIFDVQVIVRNADTEADNHNDNLSVTPYTAVAYSGSVFDMVIHFEERAAGTHIHIVYNSDIYPESNVLRLADHLLQLLEAIITTPDQPINQLNYLSPEERHQLLHVFNDTAVAYPPEITLVHLFDEQVAKTPDHIAVVHESHTLTYQQLQQQANRLAGQLQQQYDVKPGAFVGIMLDRTTDMVTAILGVLKTGAAYVPLDPELPRSRKQFIVQDTGLSVLLTQTSDYFDLDYYQGRVIGMDMRAGVADAAAMPVAVTIDPENPAYIIYTSGSTGTPKGVIIEHKAIANSIRSLRTIFDMQDDDRGLQFSSFSFDVSLFEVFTILTTGGALYILGEDAKKSPEILEQYLAQHKITVASIPPAWLKWLPPGSMPFLKRLITGGESVTPEMAAAFAAHHIYYNAYGPTETSVGVTIFRLEKGAVPDMMKLPVGRPIANMQVYILDDHMNLLPPGIAGEICISGTGLARGYLNNPELTDEKFVPHPFKPGEKLYKTGDLGRWLSDGLIEFTGRKDGQVKVRGYRIELEEIARTLQLHEAIDDAVVITRTNRYGEPELAAYFISRETLRAPDILAHLGKTLPAYMMPAYLVQMDRFPMTATDKIDKQQLPDPEVAGLPMGVDYVAPQDEMSAKMAAIWGDILGREQVGIRHNFFNIGGDSIKVLRMTTALRKELDLDIPVTDIYQYNTIENILAYVSQHKGEIAARNQRKKKAEAAVKAAMGALRDRILTSGDFPDPELVEDIYPMSDVEKGMVYESLLGAQQGIYHHQMVQRKIFPQFNLQRFEKALLLLVEQHPILRTGFNLHDFETEVQIVYRQVPVAAGYHNISHLGAAAQEAMVHDFMEQERQRPFRTNDAPLWRLDVFDQGHDVLVFVLQTHHAIVDGWSDTLFRASLYDVYLRLGIDPAYQPPVLQSDYKDFVIRQEVDKNDPLIRAFWEKELTGCPKLDLFTTEPVQEHHIAHLEEEKVIQLEMMVLQLGVTMKAFTFSAFIYMLQVMAAEREIVAGVAVNARPDCEDSDRILGCFLNSVPFRMQVNDEESCADFITQVHHQLLALKDVETLSTFEMSRLHGRKPDGGNVFFDMIFNYVDYHVSQSDLQDETCLQREAMLPAFQVNSVGRTNTYFDFSVNVTGGQLYIEFSQARRMRTGFTPEKTADLYFTILHHFIRTAHRRLYELELVDDAEKIRLLQTFNNTSLPYPQDKTVTALFEEQVVRTGNRIALEFENTRFTYDELNKKANQLAHYLRRKYNIDRDELVGIKLERSEWLVIAILGVLKAGGAYVPIEPDYPQERIDYILSECCCRVLIDERELEVFRTATTPYDNINPMPVNQPEDLIYVIYTSGSTGRPKGVMISHRAVVRLVKPAPFFSSTGNETLLATCSFAFDVSVFECWGMLLCGGTLLLCRKEVLLDETLLAREIREKKVDTMWFTTSWMNQLVEKDITLFSGLKTIITGGEQMSVSHIRKLQLQYPQLKLINGYGPTENCSFSAMWQIPNPVTSAQIGQPINNSTAYILNERLQLCGTGITGEICVGGDGVARGYLSNPELTAEKFIPHPFIPGERLYRTGDLGRWLPNGNIEFLGRKDDQLKIRGYRIEPGEIENVLQDHPTINSAVVIPKTTPAGETDLVAYIVSATLLQTDVLRNYLSSRLPIYMLPAHYVQLEQLPLSPSGKVDKKRLPDPDGASLETGVPYVAPRNEAEAQLLDIWQRLLDKTSISVLDNFFHLGGHSLRITRLLNQIHRVFEVNIVLKDLFAVPVLADQAQLITAARPKAFDSIQAVTDSAYYPLSSSQFRLWALSQSQEGNLAYNIPIAFIFDGKPDRSALAHALDTLITRHEVLRTVFHENEQGDVQQFIYPPQTAGFRMIYKDLRGEADPQQALLAQVDEAIATPFDLARGPLLRTVLYQTTDQQWAFLCMIHHTICDDWSAGVLDKELFALYEAYSNGEENPLPALRIQYKDYAVWQRHQLQSAAMASHKKYWLDLFKEGAPVLKLPADKPRPTVKTYNGGVVQRMIAPSVVAQLQAINDTQHTTLFMSILAAINVLMYHYTGQEEMVLGAPVAGREHMDLEGQIGLYLNTLAFRTSFAGTDSYLQLLAKVKAVTLGAYEHQLYPFDELVDNLPLPVEMSRNPLFDVMVVLQNATGADIPETRSAGNMIISRLKGATARHSKFDLVFELAAAGDALALGITYNNNIYLHDTVTRMAAHLEQLMQQLTEHPSLPVQELSYLSGKETSLLLETFNNTSTDYPRDHTVVALFEEQAQRTPDKTALEFEAISLTYDALNKRANQLAAWLRERYQIGPDDLVGVRLERSEWMIIAILGILKAGGAYLPVETDYPEERISYMLSDSQCKALIDPDELAAFNAVAVQYPDVNPARVNTPEDLIYVIYTSGSTGLPKGVMIEHRSVVRLVKNTRYVTLTGNETLLATGAFSFDVGSFEYWSMLLNGGRLVICRKETQLDESLLAKEIRERKVDTMWFTAGWMNQLVDRDITLFSGLKTVLAGGEQLSAFHINQLRAHYPDMELINGYGPTENTTFSLSYRITAPEEHVPVGQPISNSTAYILSDQLQLCGIGIEGEICTGGDGVARGYLNNPELTAEKFVPHPFKPGEKLYKTGDLGRYLPDGNIVFLGRKDEQVKVRGFRIEPKEIENALQKHPMVDSAVVVPVQALHGKELVAYVTGSGPLQAGALQQFLSAGLPAYMLPAHYVQLEQMPLSPNGKVDKKRLPDPEGLSLLTGTPYVAPRNATEEKLLQIWQSLLGKEKIGVEDNFFELGGNSLKAMKISTLIHKEFHVKIKMDQLTSAGTIDALSKVIIRETWAATGNGEGKHSISDQHLIL